MKPKNSRLSSVIAFNADISFGILASIVWLVLTQQAYAIPETVPRDVLTLRPDGYLYADCPGAFDDAEGEGITIEAWIYLTERPEDWDRPAANFREGQWIIFAKPGSYFVTNPSCHLCPTGVQKPSFFRRGDSRLTNIRPIYL